MIVVNYQKLKQRLSAGEVIAKDGAAFLTDKAKVKVEAKKQTKA